MPNELEKAEEYLDSHDEEVDVSYMKHMRWLIKEVKSLRHTLKLKIIRYPSKEVTDNSLK